MPEFSTNFISVLTSVDPKNYDIEQHIAKIQDLIGKFKDTDRHAHLFSYLNREEIRAMLRFVEKPHGRHHIAELEKMLHMEDSDHVLKQFMKHFYEHEGKKLAHTEIFRKLEA